MRQQFRDSEEWAELVRSGVIDKEALKRAGYFSPDDIMDETAHPLSSRNLFAQAQSGADLISYQARVSLTKPRIFIRIKYWFRRVVLRRKPHQLITWERRTEPIETIASWQSIKREPLTDEHDISKLIDNQLRMMVESIDSGADAGVI